MKEQNKFKDNDKSVQKVTVQRSPKDVEVKSIKIIQTDVIKSDSKSDKERKDILNVDASLQNVVEPRKVNFKIADDKQKEEIQINLSSKSLKKIKNDQKKKLAEEKERLKAKANLIHSTNKIKADMPKNKEVVKSKVTTENIGHEEVKKYNLEFMVLNVGVIMITILALTFSLVFLSRSSGFSESENRELYTFPKFSMESLLNGDFTSGITDFFTDTVPNREKLKSMTKKFSGYLGFSPSNASVVNAGTIVNDEKFTGTTPNNDVTIYTGTRPTGDLSNIGTGSKPVATNPQVMTENKDNDPVGNGGIDEIQNGILVINKGTDKVRAMELYGGNFKVGKQFAETLNRYKTDLGSYVNVYNMSIPMSVAYYLPKEFKDQSASVPDNINNIVSHLKDVVNVDAYSALNAHKNEYIYSRTDHHWQPLGAYYAAEAFAKQAKVDFAPLSSYEKMVKGNYVGTLYGSSGEAQLNENPDTFTYYKPSNEYTTYYYQPNLTGKEKSTLFFDWATGVNTYSVFLGKDNIVTQIDTDVKNGRTLVIYKDSFGNAIVPFLVGSFEHIYVCDYRFTEFNAIDFCNQVGATDFLFASSLFTNTTASKVDKIESNRTR
ncbi:MAG: hypothetical protein GX896_04785 [Clostridiales bacterium]|nr:hypothetical protein [Clostridiales bacterium]